MLSYQHAQFLAPVACFAGGGMSAYLDFLETVAVQVGKPFETGLDTPELHNTWWQLIAPNMALANHKYVIHVHESMCEAALVNHKSVIYVYHKRDQSMTAVR